MGVCVPLSCKYPPRAGRLRGRLKSPAPEAASVPASFLLLRTSVLWPPSPGHLPRAMAPKRQSAILPQPKKPRPVAAPKLEDKSASPGLPKGGKFLHCVSLVIESAVVFFCPPPPPQIPLEMRPSQTLVKAFLPGRRGMKLMWEIGAKKRGTGRPVHRGLPPVRDTTWDPACLSQPPNSQMGLLSL